MNLSNKFIRTFAIFASVLMLTIVAMPMVAAEEPTTLLTSTENEIKREFVLDETISNNEINKIPPIPPWVIALIGAFLGNLLYHAVVTTINYGQDRLTSFTAQTINVNRWILRGRSRSIDFNLNVPLRSNRDADYISLTVSAFDVDSGENHRVYIDIDNRFTHDDLFLGTLRVGGNQRNRITRFTIKHDYLDDVQDMMNDHSGKIRVRVQACSGTRTDGNVFIRAVRLVVDY